MTPPQSIVPALAAHEISKYYKGKRVLNDVSCRFQPGSITALIGSNGCGKSTLLRALSLLDLPQAGQITIDDKCYHFPISKGKKMVAPWPTVTLVFQQLFLWPHLTVQENIVLPLKIANRYDYLDTVKRLIDLLDMEEYANRYPNQISLGQRQRAAIARALALEPKYLLLDEITSALDIEQVNTLLNHLKLLRQQGMCIVLVTHLIGFAKQAADQILFMRDGRIEESGSTEILTTPQSEYMMKFLSLHEATTDTLRRK